MKNQSDLGLAGMLAANLSADALTSWLAKAEPIVHLLLSLGQLAIAVVTVWFIVRKIRTLKDK